MIGPIFLTSDLILPFKQHLADTDYHLVIHKGMSNPQSTPRRHIREHADKLIDRFLASDYPLVCKSGSKSSVPFWNYHAAVTVSEDRKDLFMTELLVREPEEQNISKGIVMAFYMLIGDRYPHERLIVPLRLTGLDEYEDIGLLPALDQTILGVKKKEGGL